MAYPPKEYQASPAYYMTDGYPLFEGVLEIGRMYTMPELTQHNPGDYHWALHKYNASNSGIGEIDLPIGVVVANGTRILITTNRTYTNLGQGQWAWVTVEFIVTIITPSAVPEAEETSTILTFPAAVAEVTISEIRALLVAPDVGPYVYGFSTTSRIEEWDDPGKYYTTWAWYGNTGDMFSGDRFQLLQDPAFIDNLWTGTVITEQYWPDTSMKSLGLGHQPADATYRIQISRSLDGTAISNAITYGAGGTYVLIIPAYVTITNGARVLSKGAYTFTVFYESNNYVAGDYYIIEYDIGAGWAIAGSSVYFPDVSGEISSQPITPVSYRARLIKNDLSIDVISNTISFA
jgi:hypothetical protein